MKLVALPKRRENNWPTLRADDSVPYMPSLIFPTSFGPNQGVSLANFRDPIIAPPRPSSNGFSNQPGAVFSIYQRKGLTLLILLSRFDIVSVWRRRKREIERN